MHTKQKYPPLKKKKKKKKIGGKKRKKKEKGHLSVGQTATSHA
jgi:hypothetical protein